MSKSGSQFLDSRLRGNDDLKTVKSGVRLQPDPRCSHPTLAVGVGLLLAFGILARGGWDLWAQTALHGGTVLLVALWAFKGTFRQPLAIPITPLWLPLFSLMFCLLWSSSRSLTPAVTRQELFNWVNGLGVFFLSSLLSPKERQVVRGVLLGTMVIVMVLAISQWCGSPHIAPTGSFAKSTMLAGFLVLMIPLLADLWPALECPYRGPATGPCVSRVERLMRSVSTPPNSSIEQRGIKPITGQAERGGAKERLAFGSSFMPRLRHVGVLLGMTLTSTVLIMTRSVAAWLGLLSGLFFLLRSSTLQPTSAQQPSDLGSLAVLHGNRWAPILLVVGGLGLLVKASQPQMVDRLVWWHTALTLWKSHPLIGAGLGSTEILLPQLQLAGLFSQYPHSLPFQLMAEIGVLGVVTFGWLVYRFFKHNPLLSSRLAVSGFLITNCFDYNFLLPGISLPFWFLLGTTTGSGSFKTPVKTLGNFRKSLLSRKVLLLGGILFLTSASLAAVVTPFLASRHLTSGQYLLRTGVRPPIDLRSDPDSKRMGQVEEAERMFNAAIGKNPLDPLPFALLAAMYVRRFERERSPSWLDEAILSQQEAVHRQPEQASAWEGLARLYHLRGESSEARKALLEAIHRAPSRTEYQRFLQSLTHQ